MGFSFKFNEIKFYTLLMNWLIQENIDTRNIHAPEGEYPAAALQQ
jgi:hypothetical protein